MINNISIILPVYGRSALLRRAVDSILVQTDSSWDLLIADDGSDQDTASFLDSLLDDPRITLVRRQKNLGLFGNLNLAVREAASDWLLIVCSDDILEPTAIHHLRLLANSFPSSRLFLSSYRSIDIRDQPRPDVNGIFYDRFAPKTTCFPPFTLLEPLLRYGSINGNITGLLIHKSLFSDAGPWHSDWYQAADWEWLIRACCFTSVVINRRPVARVRVHDGQLSEQNRVHYRDSREILQTLSLLINHPYLSDRSMRYQWASYHSQFILWNLLKVIPRISPRLILRDLYLIHENVGLMRTRLPLITLLPQRLKIRGSGYPLLPSD